MLKTFDKYGLRTWAEPVLDSLWRMSYPILPLISILLQKGVQGWKYERLEKDTRKSSGAKV